MNHVIPLKPSCLAYDAGQALPNGARFLKCNDFDELREFWHQHHNEYSFAARGKPFASRRLFLNPGEWIFAPTMTALVDAVVRWNSIGVSVQWNDWAQLEPEKRHAFYRELDLLRAAGIASNTWGEEEERDYGAFLANRKGFWRLSLPACLRSIDWFYQYSDEIHLPDISEARAHQIFQVRAFMDWHLLGNDEVDVFDAQDLEALFAGDWWESVRTHS